MLPKTSKNLIPIDNWTPKIAFVCRNRLRWLPRDVIWIIEAAFNCRERALLAGQLDAREHAVVADKFHDLGGELLPRF